MLPDENTWLWEAYDTLSQHLYNSIKPLYDYVKKFDKFEEENKLNPDKYVKLLDDRETPITAEELRQDIQEHKKEEDRLKDEIPDQVTVSIF